MQSFILYRRQYIDFNLLFYNKFFLSINVYPDTETIVIAPQGSSLISVKAAIKKNALWIIHRIQYFNKFTKYTLEIHLANQQKPLYMGRRYTLRIIPHTSDCVKLKQGIIYLYTIRPCSRVANKAILELWYLKKASIKVRERMHECLLHFKLKIAQQSLNILRIVLQSKFIRSRYSLFKCNIYSRRLVFNIYLVTAPIPLIDYVIYHALCHMEFPNHSIDFYYLLNDVMPYHTQKTFQLRTIL